jgi:hypothetical protein
MDCIRAGDFASSNDLMNIQIAVARWRRSNANAFVRKANMHRIGVSCGMNSDRLDAQFFTSPEHTKSDFATIGYEYLLKHCALLPVH